MNLKGRRARTRGAGALAASNMLAMAVEPLERRWLLSGTTPTRYYLPDGPAPLDWQPTAAMYGPNVPDQVPTADRADVFEAKYGEREQEHPEMADEESSADASTSDGEPAPDSTTPKPTSDHTINAPQPVGVSFLGPQLSESGFIPPDSVGDVGASNVVVISNGRIKAFDKNGNLAGLNETTDTFFASVRTATTSDPHVRYDRLSGRWFVTMIDTAAVNRVLIAVSTGSTITGHSSFNFFQFRHDSVGGAGNADTGKFADYDTLGVDKFALYVGVNIFNSDNSFFNTTGYVINKANLIAGTLTVTAFRQLIDPISGIGPYTPQGVDNDDPGATEGYFIGIDNGSFGQLDIRRVSNPGGAPTLSGNLSIVVSPTSFPVNQLASGSSLPLDALDDRLFAAEITKNKITGAVSLWTAHNIGVNSSGVATATSPRNAARWYQISNLTGSPTLTQSGTLFDSASSSPRGFWIPSIAQNGQGAALLGSSTASSTQLAGIAVAGRLPSDASGTLQAFTLAQAGLGSYNVQHPPSSNQRWGDYSQTVVDPNDDMTFWTFQEYANGTDSWGVRAIQLKALPPATPASVSPSSVTAGTTTNIVVTGTSLSGSAFFDPGLDTGGPGFVNHITASVSGTGVTVNSVTFTDTTHVTLNVTIAPGAAAGTRTITVTNPDGQSATSSTAILTVVAAATGSIAGQTYEDRNSNGSFDAGDVALNGVTVFLDTNNSGVLDAGETSVVSSGSGNYSFPSLATATYHVREIIPSGYIATSPAGGAVDVAVSGGVVTQNFGNFPIVYGTASNDTFVLRNVSGTPTRVEILVGGVSTYSILKSSLNTISFNTGAGDDTLNVDYTNGNPVPAGGVFFDGGANATTTGDILTITGSSSADSITLANAFAGPTANNININSATSTVQTVEGVVFNGNAGNDALTVASAPTAPLTFNGGLAPADVDTLNLNAGTFTFGADIKAGTANANVNVSGAATNVTFNASQHLNGLSVNNATVTLAANGGRLINTDALSVTGTGKLDLKDNDLIVRSGTLGSLVGSTYTGITGLVQSARNGGAWNGTTGIKTSVAAAGDYTTLGVATAGDALGVGTSGTGTFDGETVTGTAVLVKFTYGGDANLDGVLNIDDYTQIDSSASVGGSLKGWFNGDFNYDGDVNIDDYTILDSNIGIQSGVL